MANTDELTAEGLQTKSNLVLLNDIQTEMQENYSPNGEPINLTSASPDGNFTEILAQIGTTVRELLTEVFNSTDPSKCSGAVQDSKYQINYLYRKAGSFTIQNIDITVNKTVTLQGLDGSYDDINASSYTVSDTDGNLWYLIDTTTLIVGSTTSCAFRAKELGEITPTIGTITTQVTIIDGVTSVNNSVGYTSLGVQQESDMDFRIRREQSVSNASENNIDTIVGQLLQIDGVTEVNTWVNNTGTTDTTGTAGHTIWVIVNGGANTDIAEIIYSNMGGTGTRGDVSVNINTISGQTLIINFDRPSIVPLSVKINLHIVGEIEEINLSGIRANIIENLIYGIGEDAETSKITEIAANAVAINGGKAYVTNAQIATTGATASADIGTSTGITGATVTASIFEQQFQTSGSYEFIFDGTDWTYNSVAVNLANYGISITGTPDLNDKVIITFVSSTWTNFIISPTIASLFVADDSRLVITTTGGTT